MATSMEAPEITPLVTNKELIETFFELDHIINQHACCYEDCASDFGFDKDRNRLSFPLLVFAPFLDEDKHTAEEQLIFIEATLGCYKMSLDNIDFSTNKSGATLANKPLIGCHAHCLHLAAKTAMTAVEHHLGKLDALISKLKTFKCSATLHTKTALTPAARQETRWTSTQEMIARYFKIKQHIEEIATGDGELTELLLSPAANFSLKACYDVLNSMGLLKKRKLDSSNKVSAYIELNYIPCTSVDVESLFSMAKYITTDHRARLLPVTLEMLVFLKHNRRFWTAAHIHEALQLSGNIALVNDADD
eukprot:Em0009g274a